MFKNSPFLLKLFIIVIIGLSLIILLPTLIEVVPDIFLILRHQDHQALIAYLRSFGWAGALVLFFLQFLQTLVPIIPMLILQVAAGITYGPLLGTLIIASSNILGNILIFYLLRHLGVKELKKISRWSIFQKAGHYTSRQNPKLVVFILYLFPFLTNSLVPYIADPMKINTKDFVLMTILATVPMTFLAVWLGDSLVNRDWQSSIVIILAATFLGFLAWFIDHRWRQLQKTK